MDKITLGCLKRFISQNVKPPEQGFVTRFWPREMKVAKELFEKYPNLDFWKRMEIGFKVHSLAWFKMKQGADRLEQKYREFNFKPQNTKDNVLELSDGKIGESLHNQKGKQFLMDFLK
jgi:hypothetical protein